MQLKVTNSRLAQLANFINDLKISGAKANRGRYRLGKLLSDKYTENDAERIETAKEYAQLEENGQIKSDDQGTILFKSDDDKQAYLDANKELQSSESLITVDDYKSQLQALYDYLNNDNEELSGDDGFSFGLILDIMEDAGFTEKGDNE